MTRQTQVRSGNYSRREINQIMRPGKARDDLRTAYAGDENKGPSGTKKAGQRKQSTSLKGRETEKSKGRDKVR